MPELREREAEGGDVVRDRVVERDMMLRKILLAATQFPDALPGREESLHLHVLVPLVGSQVVRLWRADEET